MTTTAPLKPMRSGHCGVRNPPEIHANCPGRTATGHPCNCPDCRHHRHCETCTCEEPT